MDLCIVFDKDETVRIFKQDLKINFSHIEEGLLNVKSTLHYIHYFIPLIHICISLKHHAFCLLLVFYRSNEYKIHFSNT